MVIFGMVGCVRALSVVTLRENECEIAYDRNRSAGERAQWARRSFRVHPGLHALLEHNDESTPKKTIKILRINLYVSILLLSFVNNTLLCIQGAPKICSASTGDVHNQSLGL